MVTLAFKMNDTDTKRDNSTSDRRAHKSARIEDVARLAGVSPITVSRTLNQPATVAEPTRKAVELAIERLGYISNRLAGGLRATQTRTIGLVVPTLFSNIFAVTVRGMTDVFSQAGYQLLLGVSDESFDVELNHVVSFLGQRVDGIILTGGSHGKRTRMRLQQSGVPVIETNILPPDPIDMAVGYSNEEASYAMVKHLAQCGYRRIGIVTFAVFNNDRAHDRRAGYLRAVRDFDLVQRDTLIAEAVYTLSGGARGFAAMVASNPDVEAIFLTQDTAAAGAMLEAMRRGLRVPGDIGIAGYDDAEIALEFVPTLTSVNTRRYEVGATAAKMLLQRIQGEKLDATIVDSGFEIVQRESTRRPTCDSPPSVEGPIQLLGKH